MKNILKIKLEIIFFNFLTLGFFLFYTEILASILNNKFISSGFNLTQRFGLGVKTLVVLLYIVFGIISSLIVLKTLKPLFKFLKDGSNYEKARGSMIKVPYIEMIVQVMAWVIGTTAYFIIKDWSPESGIPYVYTINLKVGCGLVSGIYAGLLIRIVMMPLRKKLKIENIRKTENDFFSKNKEIFIGFAMSYFLISVSAYLLYFSKNINDYNSLDFAFSPVLTSILIITAFLSIGLFYLSKKEDILQTRFLRDKLRDLSKGESDLKSRLVLINFDYIGEIINEFNFFMDNLNSDFDEFRAMSNTMTNHTQTLNKNTENIDLSISNQYQHLSGISKSVEEFSKSMEQINKKIKNQFDIIQKNSEDFDELQNGINRVVDNTDHLSEVSNMNNETIKSCINGVTESIDKSLYINTKINEILDIIKDVKKYSNEIDDILNQLADITEETNVLAINASIEASHYGESGKGFGIIASQIRQLASTTKDSLVKTTTNIGSITSSIDRALRDSQQLTLYIDEYNKISNTTKNDLGKIIKSLNSSISEIENISSFSSQENVMLDSFKNNTMNLYDISVSIKESISEQTNHANSINNLLTEFHTESQNQVQISETMKKVVKNTTNQNKKLVDIIKKFD